MKSKLLVSGCSWTHGHQDNLDYLLWPEILSQRLGLECLNLGQRGCGNEYIFSRIYDTVMQRDDIAAVVVMWTDYFRMDFDLFRGSKFPKQIKYPDIETLFDWPYDKRSAKGVSEKSVRFVFILQSLLENLQIPYLQLSGLRPINTPRPINVNTKKTRRSLIRDCVYTMIDTQYDINKKYMYWPPINEIGGNTMWDKLDEVDPERVKLRVSSEDSHPNGRGHKFMADLIYDEYQKIYL